MMAAFKYLSRTISFDESQIQVLVIENKALFRSVLSAFEFDNSEEYFVFSKNFTPFDFDKSGIYISNPLNTDLNNKKLLSKINSYLEAIANGELYTETERLKEQLRGFASLLIQYNDYDIDCKTDIDTISIVKMLDFNINKACDSPLELLVRYMLLLSKYLGKNLFVIPNLRLLYGDEELKDLYETLRLNHINLLVIECVQPDKPLPCERVHIIDRELCEIDSDNNI